MNTEADAAHGAGVISEPPGTRRVNAWRATAIRDSSACSRSANALKLRMPRSALADEEQIADALRLPGSQEHLHHNFIVMLAIDLHLARQTTAWDKTETLVERLCT